MQNGFWSELLKFVSKRFFPSCKPPWIKAPPFIRPPKTSVRRCISPGLITGSLIYGIWEYVNISRSDPIQYSSGVAALSPFHFVPSPKNLIARRAHLKNSLCLSEVDITFYKKLLIGLESSVRGNLPLACLATVSSRVIVPKLERVLKKGKIEGGGEGEEKSPPPTSTFIQPFCSRPSVLHEVTQKRLLRRLTYKLRGKTV